MYITIHHERFLMARRILQKGGVSSSQSGGKNVAETAIGKPLRKEWIGTWHWMWYVWSVQHIYDFFDGNTGTHSGNVEDRLTSKCYYWTISRISAGTILLFQLFVVAALIGTAVALPIYLFGFWGYLFALRLIAAIVLGIIAVFALVMSVIGLFEADGLDREFSLSASLWGLGAVVAARVLLWDAFSGSVNFTAYAIVAAVLFGLVLAAVGIAVSREYRRSQSRSSSSPGRSETPAKAGPGAGQLMLERIQRAKLRVCPIIEPVRKGTLPKEGSS